MAWAAATMDNGQWAQLAETYSLIPLNGKRPIEDKWEQWCEVKREYSPGEFAGRNAGITTGPASGLLVLDIDNPDRFAFMAAEKAWDIPSTLAVETGSGKPHYYFNYPADGRRYGNKSFGPKAKRFYGFDLRGIGGQVVAPGSIHPETKKPYRIVKDVPVADCPQWIKDLYEEPQPTKQAAPPAGGVYCGDIDRLPIKAQTKDLIRNGAAPGGRSEPIMGVLNALVWSRLSDAEIYAIFERYPIGEKYREKGEGRQRWLAPQITKARGYITEYAENRTLGTSAGRLNIDNMTNNNGTLDVTDVTDGTSNGDFNFLPSVPVFPIDILPPVIQKIAIEHSTAFGVPADVPAIALLATAGACMGRTRGLVIKSGWVEYANTYIAIVGRSGTGKSPVIKAIQAPIFKIEAEWYKGYQEDLKAYQEAMEARRGRKKNDGPIEPPPDPPLYKQITIDDSTTEALTTALTHNPRGIMWNRDELSGLILDLNKYAGKDGGDKARLLSAYDSGAWKVNRNSGNKYIANACLSIFGTIQEKALPEIFSSMDAATGFLPRFNFIRVEQDGPPLWSDEVVSEESKKALTHLLGTLLKYDFNINEPIFIGVRNEAKGLFIDWYNDQAREPWGDCESSIYEAVLAKLRGQCLRYCLILHCVESAVNREPEVKPITADTMEKAIFLSNYLKAHQKSIWQLCFLSEGVRVLKPFERRIAEALISLEAHIKGGMLPTQTIVDELNKGVGEGFHTNPRTVGKALSGMGFETAHLPDKSGRGPKITPEQLEKLNSTIGERPKRPKRPTTEFNNEIMPQSNVRQTSQTSGLEAEPPQSEVPVWEF